MHCSARGRVSFLAALSCTDPPSWSHRSCFGARELEAIDNSSLEAPQ
jgi:hypothetical protein